jgi:hypothetical protein
VAIARELAHLPVDDGGEVERMTGQAAMFSDQITKKAFSPLGKVPLSPREGPI